MSTTKAKITVKPSQPVLAAWAPSMRLYSAALTKTPSSNGCRPQRPEPCFRLSRLGGNRLRRRADSGGVAARPGRVGEPRSWRTRRVRGAATATASYRADRGSGCAVGEDTSDHDASANL